MIQDDFTPGRRQIDQALARFRSLVATGRHEEAIELCGTLVERLAEQAQRLRREKEHVELEMRRDDILKRLKRTPR